MAYKIELPISYGDLSGDDLLQILNDKFGLFNNFDNFVNKKVFEGYMYDFDDLDEFITFCLQEYLLTSSHGVSLQKDGFPFISTGRLVMNIRGYYN